MFNVMRGLLRLPGSTKSVILLVCLLAAAQNLLLLSLPLYTIQLFDRVLSTGSVETLIALTLLAAIALVTMSAIDGLATLALRRAGHSLVVNAQLGNGKLRQNTKEESAGFVGSTLASPAFRAYLDFPWVSVFLIVLLALDAALVVVCVLGIAALVAAAYLSPLYAGGKRIAQTFNQHQTMYAAPSGMSDRVLAVRRENTVSLSRAEDTDARCEARATSLMRCIRLLVQVGLLGTGCYLVLLGDLTPGGIIAASILGARALSPFEHARTISKFGKPFADNADHLAAPDPDEARSEGAATGNAVELIAAFAADKSVHTGVTGPITLKIPRGETLGIVQGYGSGAETVAHLAACLETPVRGHVRIARHSRNEQPLAAALPNSPLYEGTIAENICCFAPPHQERLDDALSAAGIKSAVQKLDHGQETALRGDGHDLDGAMRDALILARAFYAKSALKVFVDCPASSLSAWLSAREPDCGVLIVTNDRSVLRKCNRVLMMSDGRIRASSEPGEVTELFGNATGNVHEMEGAA